MRYNEKRRERERDVSAKRRVYYPLTVTFTGADFYLHLNLISRLTMKCRWRISETAWLTGDISYTGILPVYHKVLHLGEGATACRHQFIAS
jgi:hypothetical protein